MATNHAHKNASKLDKYKENIKNKMAKTGRGYDVGSLSKPSVTIDVI